MGKRIQTRRKELRIKQATFAETLNISTNHLSAIENGKEKPSFDTFVNICNCLNVTPDYLLLGDMYPLNIPKNIAAQLQLCSPSDIELAQEFIELLVQRNANRHISD